MRLLIILTLVALASCKEKPFELPEDQPIEHESVIMQEFIYGLENAPTLEAHASTVEKSNGTVVASWFGGTKKKIKMSVFGSLEKLMIIGQRLSRLSMDCSLMGLRDTPVGTQFCLSKKMDRFTYITK